MNDVFFEELVPRKTPAKDKFLSILMKVLVGFFVLFTLVNYNTLLFIITVALGVGAYFLLPNFSVEWEYQYLNGELDIDKILQKTKRKRVESFQIQDAEIIAPVSSHQLDYYNNNPNLKVKDYSSMNPENEKKRFAMIIGTDKGLVKVLFEPSEKMLKDMKTKAPRKVFFD